MSAGLTLLRLQTVPESQMQCHNQCHSFPQYSLHLFTNYICYKTSFSVFTHHSPLLSVYADFDNVFVMPQCYSFLLILVLARAIIQSSDGTWQVALKKHPVS